MSKLFNDSTTIIKAADKGVAAVILSTEHYKTMIMQHLDDASSHKKGDLNIDMKIHKNLKKLLNIYNKCFKSNSFLTRRSSRGSGT